MNFLNKSYNMKKISKKFSAPVTVNKEEFIVCGIAYRWPDEDPKEVDEFDFDIDEVYYGNENIIAALKALNGNDITNYRELKEGAHDYIVDMFRNEHDWFLDGYFVFDDKIELLVATNQEEESKSVEIEKDAFLKFVGWDNMHQYEVFSSNQTIYSDLKEYINSQNVQVI